MVGIPLVGDLDLAALDRLELGLKDKTTAMHA
jgi:hypothetical protein